MLRIHLIGLSVLAVLAAPALAHHSYSMYDMQAERSLSGEVERVEWVNPHILIWLRTPDQGDATMAWRIEGHAPVMLSRNGFDRDVLRDGDQIHLTFHPLREGNGGSLVSLTLPDRRTFNRFGSLIRRSS